MLNQPLSLYLLNSNKYFFSKKIFYEKNYFFCFQLHVDNFLLNTCNCGWINSQIVRFPFSIVKLLITKNEVIPWHERHIKCIILKSNLEKRLYFPRKLDLFIAICEIFLSLWNILNYHIEIKSNLYKTTTIGFPKK